MSVEQELHPFEKIIEFYTHDARHPSLGNIIKPLLIAFAAQTLCVLPKYDYQINPENIGYQRYTGMVKGLEFDSIYAYTEEERALITTREKNELNHEVDELKKALAINHHPVTIVPTKNGLYEQVRNGKDHEMRRIGAARLVQLVDDLISQPPQLLPQPFRFENVVASLLRINQKNAGSDVLVPKIPVAAEHFGMLGVVFDKLGVEMIHMEEKDSYPGLGDNLPKEEVIDGFDILDYPKITCTLEAGVLLTEHPKRVVDKYLKQSGDVEVSTSTMTESRIKGGVNKALSILNTPPDNRVKVEEVRLVANLLMTDSLAYDPKAKRWFFKGGLTNADFLGGELSNQVTPILEGTAHCWHEIGKEEGSKFRNYEKIWSYYVTQDREVFSDAEKSPCKDCKLKQLCLEYNDHRKPVETVTTGDTKGKKTQESQPINTRNQDRLYKVVDEYLTLIHGMLYERVRDGYVLVYMPLWGPSGRLVEADILPLHGIQREAGEVMNTAKPDMVDGVNTGIDENGEETIDVVSDTEVTIDQPTNFPNDLAGPEDIERDDYADDEEEDDDTELEPEVTIDQPKNFPNDPYAGFEDIPDGMEPDLADEEGADGLYEDGDLDLDAFGSGGNFPNEKIKPRIFGGDDENSKVFKPEAPTNVRSRRPRRNLEEYEQAEAAQVGDRELQPKIVGGDTYDDDTQVSKQGIGYDGNEEEIIVEPMPETRRRRPGIQVNVGQDFDPDNPPERQRQQRQGRPERLTQGMNSQPENRAKPRVSTTAPGHQSFGRDELEIPEFLAKRENQQPQGQVRQNRQSDRAPRIQPRPTQNPEPRVNRTRPDPQLTPKQQSRPSILDRVKGMAAGSAKQQPSTPPRFDPATHEAKKWSPPKPENPSTKPDLFGRLEGAINSMGNFDPLKRNENAGLIGSDGKVNLGVLKKMPDHPLAVRLDGMKRGGAKITGVYANPDGSYDIVVEKTKQQVTIYGGADEGDIDEF